MCTGGSHPNPSRWYFIPSPSVPSAPKGPPNRFVTARPCPPTALPTTRLLLKRPTSLLPPEVLETGPNWIPVGLEAEGGPLPGVSPTLFDVVIGRTSTALVVGLGMCGIPPWDMWYRWRLLEPCTAIPAFCYPSPSLISFLYMRFVCWLLGEHSQCSAVPLSGQALFVRN